MPSFNFSALFCAILLSLCLAGSNFLENYQKQRDIAESLYIKAVERSRAQLRGLGLRLWRELNSRPIVAGPSLSALLKNELRHGELEQVGLWEGDCQLLARAAINSFNLTCNAPGDLIVYHDFGENVAYRLGLQVDLAEPWLTNFGLSKRLANLGLSVSEGALKGSSWLEVNLGAYIPELLVFLKKACLVLAFLLVFLVLWSWAYVRSSLGKEKLKKAAFVQFALKLIKDPNELDLQVPLVLAKDLDCQKMQDLSRSAAEKREAEQLNLTRELARLQSLELELQTLSRENQVLRQQKSLSVQVMETVPKMLARLNQEWRYLNAFCGQTLADFIKLNRQHLEIWLTWQKGLREKGSRKFLRSLCEQQGLGDKTGLEMELANLSVLSQKTQAFCMGLRADLEKTKSRYENHKQILSHWYSLSLGAEVGENRDLVEQIHQGAAVLGENLHLQLQVADFVDKKLPLPGPVAVATFYHLLAFLHSETGAGIMVHYKEKSGYGYIIFSVPAFTERGFSFHWQQVQHLLESFPVTLSFLPADRCSVTISWGLEVKHPNPGLGNKSENTWLAEQN